MIANTEAAMREDTDDTAKWIDLRNQYRHYKIHPVSPLFHNYSANEYHQLDTTHKHYSKQYYILHFFITLANYVPTLSNNSSIGSQSLPTNDAL